MLKILVDENFDHRILRGLVRRMAGLDFVVAQDHADIAGSDDPGLLAWAAEHDRVVVTHDVNTVTDFAFARVEAGLAMPGVIIVPEDLGIGAAIEELEIILTCGDPADFASRVEYLPL